MVLNVHRNLIRDVGKWGGGMEVGRERDYILSLHCHHQNDSCIKTGSDESHFNVSVGSDGQSHKTVSTNHNLFWRERRAEAVSNRGPSAYQPNALPLGQTGSLYCVLWVMELWRVEAVGSSSATQMDGQLKRTTPTRKLSTNDRAYVAAALDAAMIIRGGNPKAVFLGCSNDHQRRKP